MRSLNPSGTVGQPDLVAFWDGGDSASGCVVYIRYKLEVMGPSGECYSMVLLGGKAQVTPLLCRSKS